MNRYQKLYRRAFETLGRGLRSEDGCPDEEILAAERRLGVRMPTALADFYRFAGRAADYTSVLNSLLSPSALTLQSGKLAFMEENQAVVLWATDAGAGPIDDPPAYQATNDESLVWKHVNERCSVFLIVMLHWEAAFGGAMPNARTSIVDRSLVKILDRDWSFVGEVNGMRAYNKPGTAICFLKWDDGWRIFAGCTSDAGMNAIASEFGVAWETAT
jgi:hypothetical protein